MSFLSKVVKELPNLEELEALDTEVGASFSSNVIATLFSTMVPVASTMISERGVAAALVGKRKQISLAWMWDWRGRGDGVWGLGLGKEGGVVHLRQRGRRKERV